MLQSPFAYKISLSSPVLIMLCGKKSIFFEIKTLYKYERLFYAERIKIEMTGAISTNYYNNPFAFMGAQYSINPLSSLNMANMTSSLFGLASGNYNLNNWALGNLSNVPNWNADLMMPQWMQNLQNAQYGFQQYNFNGLGAYTMPQFATGTQATGTQTGTTATGLTTGTGATGAQQTVTNPYAQATQTNETTMKLNMYGISTTGDSAKDAKALKNAEAKEAKTKEQAAAIAEKLYDAMKGAGTKNDQLRQALGQLNNENILYVLEEWNTNYSGNMDGESLIQSIQDEYHSGFFSNEQKNVEKILCDALFNKAKSLGMSGEAHAFRAKINAEHGNSWWLGGSSDKSIQTSVDTIISQISQKDVQNRQAAYNRAVSKNK